MRKYGGLICARNSASLRCEIVSVDSAVMAELHKKTPGIIRGFLFTYACFSAGEDSDTGSTVWFFPSAGDSTAGDSCTDWLAFNRRFFRLFLFLRLLGTIAAGTFFHCAGVLFNVPIDQFDDCHFGGVSKPASQFDNTRIAAFAVGSALCDFTK